MDFDLGALGSAPALAIPAGARPAPAPRPALVVLIAVDQMRGDYLRRYAGQWTGGFRRLLDQDGNRRIDAEL